MKPLSVVSNPVGTPEVSDSTMGRAKEGVSTSVRHSSAAHGVTGYVVSVRLVRSRSGVLRRTRTGVTLFGAVTHTGVYGCGESASLNY